MDKSYLINVKYSQDGVAPNPVVPNNDNSGDGFTPVVPNPPRPPIPPRPPKPRKEKKTKTPNIDFELLAIRHAMQIANVIMEGQAGYLGNYEYLHRRNNFNAIINATTNPLSIINNALTFSMDNYRELKNKEQINAITNNDYMKGS